MIGPVIAPINAYQHPLKKVTLFFEVVQFNGSFGSLLEGWGTSSTRLSPLVRCFNWEPSARIPSLEPSSKRISVPGGARKRASTSFSISCDIENVWDGREGASIRGFMKTNDWKEE
jgi:hypothetical protein